MKTKSTNRHFFARAAMLLMLLFTTVSAWADLSGRCGPALWYNYKSSSQTLTIFKGAEGQSGSMYDYYIGDNQEAPWKSIRGEIKKVVIDADVTDIGNYAFYNCTALTKVIIASTVTSIGNGAFNNCIALTSINLPDGVTRISNAAFSGCEQLSSITIPNTVVTIEDYAFENCKALTSFAFPSGLTTISKGIFRGCSGLTAFTIPDGVTSIGQSAFAGCTALVDVTIPNTMTSIGESAFIGCSSLMSVTIPDGVTSIGSNAFRSCSVLTNVTIPTTITSIDKDAFYGCSSLMTVYCYAPIPPTLERDKKGKYPFMKNASGRKFYVPEESLVAYQESWSDYSDDIVGIPVYTITLQVSPDNTFGAATLSTTVAAQGDKVTLTAIPNEGYQFIWWDVTGGAVITKPSAEHTTLTMPKKNLTLTAMFRGTDDNPYTYTLTLDDNDDNPWGVAEIHQGIKSYTLPTRTRTGYYFLGWATSATGTPAYKAGETVNLEKNLTLYAIWLEMPVMLADNASNAATISKLKDLGAIDVKLNGRSLYKDGYWNTLCLPFSLTATQLEDSPLAGATLMELDTECTNDNRQTGFDAATGTLNLYFKTATTIEAGKPYLIKWGTPNSDPDAPIDVIYNPTFTGVTVNGTGSLSVTSADGAVSFLGTYNPISIGNEGDNTILYMGAESTLYHPNAAMDINSFRAYFQLNNGLVCGNPNQGGSSINAFVLNFDDETTGIVSIENSRFFDERSGKAERIIENGADAWYTLDGRKLNGKPSAKGIYINNGHKVVIK